MKHILVAVDLQNDFIDGALGTKEAEAIVDSACRRIAAHEGPILVTLDTHETDYPTTREGRFLPVPHCIKGTDGWQLHKKVQKALKGKAYLPVEKPTFGSVELPALVKTLACGEPFDITLLGLCTDICVVSNALLLKAAFPEADVFVDGSACAGVTPGKHEAALETMRSCQITVL